MPPQLRVFTPNPRFEQRAKMDISTSLAAVLKTNSQLGPKEALWAARNHMLANNPYTPPSNGKCPINELPAEILGHIFNIGVEMGDDDDDDDDSEGSGGDDDWEDTSDEDDVDDNLCLNAGSLASVGSSIISSGSHEDPLFQVLVSHVCRHWREVALNLQGLWTTLRFESTLQLGKAKVFIDRARGLPLKIYIDCENTDEVEDSDHGQQTHRQIEPFLSQNDLMQILDLVEPEVSHWGEFIFDASTYNHFQCLLSRLHKLPSAPLLKIFHVYDHEDCHDYEFFNGPGKTSYLPFHGNAPLLESAIFWGIHIDWNNSLPFLQGLRELELSYHAKDVRPSYATFMQIIKNSPDLHSLSLSISGPALATGARFDAEDQWGREPLDIPSVHYLTLQFHEPQYASALIQHIYFPNLHGLTLNFDEGDYTSFVRNLLVPVKGRPKSILFGLQNLRISGLPCDIATVGAMLQQLTRLKTFHLKCFGSEELVILKKLIDPSAGSKRQGTQVKTVGQAPPRIFCPLLETLTISHVRESHLKALVLARKCAGAPLKTLRLSYEDDISMRTRDWLSKHVEVVEFFDPSDSEEEVDEDDQSADDEEDEDEGLTFGAPSSQHLHGPDLD